MFPRKEPLTELKLLRWSQNAENVASGGSDGLPTQQRFLRFYRKGKELFRLEKDDTPYSGASRQVYKLTRVVKDTFVPRKVGGQEQWGEAFSWADAERAIMESLDASCIQRDHQIETLEKAISGK